MRVGNGGVEMRPPGWTWTLKQSGCYKWMLATEDSPSTYPLALKQQISPFQTLLTRISLPFLHSFVYIITNLQGWILGLQRQIEGYWVTKNGNSGCLQPTQTFTSSQQGNIRQKALMYAVRDFQTKNSRTLPEELREHLQKEKKLEVDLEG